MRRKLFGNEHPILAISLNNLAAVLQQERKLDEAEALQREALAIYRKRWGSEHPNIVASLINLAGILEQQNKQSEAEATHREAVAMQKKVGQRASDVAATLKRLAELTNRPPATNSAGEAKGRVNHTVPAIRQPQRDRRFNGVFIIELQKGARSRGSCLQISPGGVRTHR